MTKNLIRLPLEKIYNARDIGGYPAMMNKSTSFGVFVRSDDLCQANGDDIDYLYNYNIRTIIDLRTHTEVCQKSHPFASDNRFCYINLPLLDDLPTFDKKSIKGANLRSLVGDLYVNIIEKQHKNIKEIFCCIAQKIPYGGILFHCSAGKDRTGVISALLMMLASVPRLDIVANYMVSAIYLSPVIEKLRLAAPDTPPAAFSSDPDDIIRFIDYIDNKYNGAENFLLSANVPMSDIDLIRNKLV